VMAAAVLLGPGTAQAGFLRIAGAIIRHAGGGSRNRRRWDDRDGRSLDDNLGRRRRNIGGSVAGFLGGLIGGGATADHEKGGGKT